MLVPSNAFHNPSDSANHAWNLDIAARYIVGGALPSPQSPALPTNNPPLLAQNKTTGVNKLLYPYFEYETTATPTGINSKFSLLLPYNARLLTQLGENQASGVPKGQPAIGQLVGAVTPTNGTDTGVGAQPQQLGIIATLEACAYYFQLADPAVTREKLVIDGLTYLKISVDRAVASSSIASP
jgi:hypothetical protein